MSSIRRRRQLAAAVVVASTGLAGMGWTLPAVAVGSAASTLYVSDDPAAHCSDAGQGTEVQPYCTIQAGVDAATAGQTVLVDFGAGDYVEQVDVKHSGEPGKPIVIKGRPDPRHEDLPAVTAPFGGGSQKHAFSLDGVHDVTVQGFYLADQPQESILVTDSARVTLDGNTVLGGWGTSPAVRLTGTTSATTVSRNAVGGAGGGGIVVDPGVTGTVVTTNAVTANSPAGILVKDAPGTVVTSNTVVCSHGTGISLAGNSDHATVENNIVAASDNPVLVDAAHSVELAVSAGSVTGTKADYNTLHPLGKGSAYSWGGTTYQQPADFTAASTQGAHDLREAPKFLLDGSANASVVPTAASGSTDSADASAPGELATDLYGHARVDDPQVDNSPGGFHDRGAVELQPFSGLRLSVPYLRGPYPLAMTATATVQWNWTTPATYTFDFGDGSAPVVSTSPKAEHVYQNKGRYRVKVTVADTKSDATLSADVASDITVNEPGDLVPDAKITLDDRGMGGGPLGYLFDATGTTSPWYVDHYEIDFGDGSPVNTYGYAHHSYARPGDYTVTVKVSDQGGRAATLTKQLHVAYAQLGFTPITPTRVLDTRQPGMNGIRRIGPGESVDVYLPTTSGHADAAVLNVTAVNPSQGGYLSVYPTGAPRPTTSNVNFTAGQVVPNLVTVPTGQGDHVTVYNFSGATDVVVDVMGYYQSGTGSRFTALAPSRLLDTRHTTALGPDATTSVQVRGVGGVPADATAAVLNLTSTDADAGGYLTAFASGTTRPGTSNLNFTAGQTVANQVVVPIGADGKVSIYNKFGHTQVVADLFGYYSPTGSSLFTPVVPTRLVDTRTAGQHALGQGGTLPVASGAPAGATGAVLNVTSTASTAGGYLTVWADGAAKPGTSNVNFLAGKTVPNHVTTPLGANGSFDVYNFLGQTQVVADLFGYFSK
ncbi:PKD domain-containing protein [Kitasatospora sp. McL0602]|uniref:PKD domain-containing protein n=1 Tax=Kitasatospora sp. McL0602 TaxID=3439530 RepID=UPI003F88A05A